MIVPCPHCGQSLDLADALADQRVHCPQCRKEFAAPRTIPKRRSVPSPLPRRIGGLGRFLLFLLLLGVGALGFAFFRLGETPRDLWQKMIGSFENPPEPAPAAPSLLPTSPPVAVSEPAPVSTPPPHPSPAPTPAEKDPLAWLLEHPAALPKEATLRKPVEFPVMVNGQPAGSVRVLAGSTLKISRFEAEVLTVIHNGVARTIAPADTDLRDRAIRARDAAEAERQLALRPAAQPTPAPQETPHEAPQETERAIGEKSAFLHPGMLHNEEDFERMRRHRARDPWSVGLERLLANRHAQLDWRPNPAEVIIRGSGRDVPGPENYRQLYNDTAAAYACALRWKITRDRDYAEKALEILNAWSSTLKQVTGSSDKALAAGFYGYQFANAAEIMRTYRGWKAEDFQRFQKMLREVFLPINEDFLARHNNTKIDHYWANWDLCNMASLMAIGILCDDRGLYNKAVRYFKFGKGNGAVKNAVYYIHPDGLGQWQEAGRDQGHSTLGIPLMATICEMAWKQGDDLYGYDNNRFLAGCEYVAKYNLGEEVPFKTYVNTSHGTQEVISEDGRGEMRPGWEMVYNHYVIRKRLAAPYTTRMAEKIRPEGGGGDYGPNSGGYDQLGYGTLTATLDPDAPDKDR